MIRVVSVITVEDGDDDHNKIKRGKGQECTFILCRRGFLLEIIPLFPGKTPKVQVRSWSDHYGAEMDGVCKYGVYALKEQGAKALIIHVHCLH